MTRAASPSTTSVKPAQLVLRPRSCLHRAQPSRHTEPGVDLRLRGDDGAREVSVSATREPLAIRAVHRAAPSPTSVKPAQAGFHASFRIAAGARHLARSVDPRRRGDDVCGRVCARRAQLVCDRRWGAEENMEVQHG